MVDIKYTDVADMFWPYYGLAKTTTMRAMTYVHLEQIDSSSLMVVINSQPPAWHYINPLWTSQC